MATRLYLARIHTPAASAGGGVRLDPAPWLVAPQVAWEDKTGGTWAGNDLWLSTNTTEGRTDAQTTYQRDKGSATTDRDVLLARALSPPMAGSQTISGTVKGQFAFREDNAADDCRAQFSLRVIAPDGTVRGTLYDQDANALGSDEFGTAGSTYYNRNVPRGGSQTVTNVAVTAGDRLLMELGFRSHATGSTIRGAEVVVGTNASSGDLPEDQTTSSGLDVYRGWLELSHTVTWQADYLEVDQIVLQAGVKIAAADNVLEVSQVVMQIGARVFAHGWGIVEVGEVEMADAVLGTNPSAVLGAASSSRSRAREGAHGTTV